MPSTDARSADSDGSSSALDPDATAFASVDWETAGGRRWPLDGPTTGLVLALAALAALFAYDSIVAPEELVRALDWDLTRVDWLTVLSGVLMTRYGVVPLVVNRRRSGRFVRAFLRRPAAVLSLLYLLVFVVVGIVGPDTFFALEYPRYDHKFQPPAFTTVSVELFPYYTCVGEQSNGVCEGTLQYPLGTTRFGQNMLRLIMHGMRIGLQLGLSAAMIMTVLATAVGSTAGYVGGRVDDVLTSFVDFQRMLPAIIVYLVLSTIFLGNLEGVTDGRMFALILVFGLFNWGGMARRIRSDVLTQRSNGYVMAAQAAGASDGRILRHHIVPNVRATVVTSLTRRVPLLILAQVALAYLDINRVDNRSLGRVLRFAHVGNQALEGAVQVPWHQKWWVSVFPLLFLACTVLAFNFLGDALRDLLDVQEEVK